MASKSGLGRGLEALFGEVSVNPEGLWEEAPGKAGKPDAKKADKKPAGKKKEAQKSKGKKPQTPSATKGKAPEQEDADRVQYLDVHKLKPNTDQPRKEFDEERIDDLAESIRAHGVLQPLVVQKTAKGYQIVMGERRWRAAQRAGLKTVPCLVRQLTEEENMVVALIENIQREDLNAIEEAEALDKMIRRYGLTQEQVSQAVGRSRPYIANALRLLKLPEEVRQLVSSGALTAGHARAIAGIKDPEKQISIAHRTVENGWSVRQTELFADEKKEAKKARKPRKSNKTEDVRTVEEELKRILGTRVNLVVGPKKGHIEIEYYSREELDRLIDLLRSLQ